MRQAHLTVRATPEEWQVIGPFIRKSCKSVNLTSRILGSLLTSPKAYFDDRIKLFEHLYGNKADVNAVLGLNEAGQYSAKIVMSDKDATILRMFHDQHVEIREMVATD